MKGIKLMKLKNILKKIEYDNGIGEDVINDHNKIDGMINLG